MSYNTKQKRDILQCFEENKNTCLKARDVIDLLHGNIGEATVYRCLSSLEKEGVIKRFITEKGQSSYYQFVSCDKCETHFHMKCTSCGKLLHIDCEFLQSFDDHISSEHGFTVDNAKTVIYGICSDCSAKNNITK